METKSAEIRVALSARELAAVDGWRKKQPDSPERPEALRRLALRALRDEDGGSETTALGDLNASNDE